MTQQQKQRKLIALFGESKRGSDSDSDSDINSSYSAGFAKMCETRGVDPLQLVKAAETLELIL